EQVRGPAGVPAWPALVAEAAAEAEAGGVALRVFADRDEARRAHAGGVLALLGVALADRMREARRQLPLSPKLALLYAAATVPAADHAPVAARGAAVSRSRAGRAPGGNGKHAASLDERLRQDLVDGAFAALAGDAGERAAIRSRGEFDALATRVGRGLFPGAMERLALAEAILDAVAAVKPLLTPELMGFARGHYDDLERQLARLVYPG